MRAPDQSDIMIGAAGSIQIIQIVIKIGRIIPALQFARFIGAGIAEIPPQIAACRNGRARPVAAGVIAAPDRVLEQWPPLRGGIANGWDAIDIKVIGGRRDGIEIGGSYGLPFLDTSIPPDVGVKALIPDRKIERVIPACPTIFERADVEGYRFIIPAIEYPLLFVNRCVHPPIFALRNQLAGPLCDRANVLFPVIVKVIFHACAWFIGVPSCNLIAVAHPSGLVIWRAFVS